MDMVGHNHDYFQVQRELILVKTTLQDNSACPVWKDPALVSAECKKMWFRVSLHMRKVAAVESLLGIQDR